MKTIPLLNTRFIGLTLFFLFIFSFDLHAQGWSNIYPQRDTSELGNIGSKFTITTSTIDGGFLSCRQDHLPGQATNYGKLNLVKVDKEGIEQWNRIYNNPFISNPDNPYSSDPMVYEVYQNPDASIVVAGRYLYGNTDVFLTKFDQFGNLVWTNQYVVSSYLAHKTNFAKTANGYLQAFDHKTSTNGIGLRKIDESGNLIWSNYLPTVDQNSIIKVVALSGNNFDIITNLEIYTVNATGNLVGRRDIVSTNRIEALNVDVGPDGGYLFTGRPYYSSGINVFKNDPSGMLVWDSTYSQFSGTGNLHAAHSPDGGYVMAITQGNYYTPQGNNVLAIKLDSTLKVLWFSSYPGTANDLNLTKDSSFVISGFTDGKEKIGQLIKLDKNGMLFDNHITGNIYNDVNLNCAPGQNEPGLDNWKVEAKGDITLYALSDTSGNYSIWADSGSYDLRVILPHPFYESCAGTQTVQVTGNDTIITDFPIKTLVNCPYLTVDVSTNFLRRCFSNTYWVDYCNQGIVNVPNAVVELEFHPNLIVTSSSIPWSNQVGNTFTFPIGNLNVNQCGGFTVKATPDCILTTLGQTLCVFATIKPDSICNAPNPVWDGSITDLNMKCETDSLTFTIKNTGTGGMATPLEYFVIEDNLVSRQGFFQLAASDSMLIKVPSNGSSYRINAAQAPGYFPVGYHPTLAYEGCGVNANGNFSIGFVNMYPENDILNTESVDCHEIVGAHDPNDKRAAPEGYGYRHYIEVGDDLDYHIRFQNTGTDTAFTVVIRDTISEHLDLASLLPGASSHPYDLDIFGNMLKFTFNNILLVDSFTNEAASHGFVKFKISQKDSLPLGTLIHNEAAIYFDFNEPIFTNETYHEIGEDFIPSDPTTVDVSLFLEGAYDKMTGIHTTELINRNLMPSGQPYSIAPWNYPGEEGSGWTTVDYPPGTVDWVLVSLRETLSPDSEVAKGAAVLLEDGRLHAFDLVVPGNIDSAFVAVYHRNHLPVLSPYRIGISNLQLSYDFRTMDSYQIGTGFGQKQIGAYWGLFAGNGASSSFGNDINANDKALWLSDNGYFNKYFVSDYNLDGDINGIDKILWNVNNGIFTGIK